MTRNEATAILTAAASSWLEQGGSLDDETVEDCVRADTVACPEVAEAVAIVGEDEAASIYLDA